MPLADTQEYIRNRIADYCVQIADIFKKDRPRYVTVIVRPPDRPEQEVIVTNDPDAQAVIATIQRRFGLSVPQGERSRPRTASAGGTMKKIQVPSIDHPVSALDGYTLTAIDTDPAESLALLEANAKARGIEVVATIKRQFTPERSGFIVVTFDPRRATPAQEP